MGRRKVTPWFSAVMAAAMLLSACAGNPTASEPTNSPAPVEVERQPQPTQTASTEARFPKNAQGYADITVDQLAAMLANKDFTLVNVHVPYEGELPQTDLFIPYDRIEAEAGELRDKAAPIVLYCSSGRMSTIAAETLVKLGYTNVMEVDGGFSGWRAAGHELVVK